MTCRRSVSQTDSWRSTAMRTASDLAGRVALPSSPPPREWRSCTMRMLDAAVTPGTAANFAVTLAVTTLLIPRIPSRTLAMAAGFAASSILR
ncbi:MAG: hypothetical protein KO254_04610 [Methanoculleus marisnigri]|nr:hypothetical protein [Methanoculleus marisnigri]